MTLAREERSALVNTMGEVGPDAPTLCGEWDVRSLAAHLVLRERRLDAAAGVFVPFLAGYTNHVQKGIAGKDWPALLDDVRTGPPLWSPFRLIDGQVNFAEMFVHHEDVRRAGGEWTTRELSAEFEKKSWSTLRLIGKRSYRSSTVPVRAETPGGQTMDLAKGDKAHSGGAGVVLVGTASELVLHAFGRDQVTLDFRGSAEDVAALKASDRSV